MHWPSPVPGSVQCLEPSHLSSHGNQYCPLCGKIPFSNINHFYFITDCGILCHWRRHLKWKIRMKWCFWMICNDWGSVRWNVQMCNRKCSITRGKYNPTHRKRISKYCTISCGIKHQNPLLFVPFFSYCLPNWEAKFNGHPHHMKIQGCQKSEQKPDTKETCFGDVTRSANDRTVFKSRDFLRPMRGLYFGDTESWHRVIRHGRNINVIIIIKKSENISVNFFPSSAI